MKWSIHKLCSNVKGQPNMTRSFFSLKKKKDVYSFSSAFTNTWLQKDSSHQTQSLFLISVLVTSFIFDENVQS